MRWLALPAGVFIIAFTLVDVFHTLVLPRAARRRVRLTRIVFLALWGPWRWIGIRRKTLEARERWLGLLAPGVLFVFLAVWAFLIMLGFALVLWSPAFAPDLAGAESHAGFGTILYFSGTSLFTIGFGDLVETGLARTVSVIEGAMGLGLVAVVIAYLPVLYQSFNRREVGILLLDARAGSPPSGPELLLRTARMGDKEGLVALFREWERWTADILETHLSYPLLAFFRSPHDYTSWVTSLGAVLDAATLVLSVMDKPPHAAAEALYDTGAHAVEDLFYYFRTPEREAVIGRDEFDEVLRDLKDAGIPLRPADEAWEQFIARRGKYGGRLDGLAVMVAAPPAQWIGDRSSLPASREVAARH